MCNSTGLADDQFNALDEHLKTAVHDRLKQHTTQVKIPVVLGITGVLDATLKYLRRNRIQVDLAESHGVFQSTISRAIATVTALLVVMFRHVGPICVM